MAPASAARAATVVVADDDDDFRETLRLWAANRPEWTVRAASDGREALAVAPGADVVVLDRDMPEVSGTEVVSALAERDFDGEIVVLSGTDPDARLAPEDVTRYLTKPVRRDRFLAALDDVLS